MKELFTNDELITLITEKGYEEINNSEMQIHSIAAWFRNIHFLHAYIVPYGDRTSWSIASIGYTNLQTDEGRLVQRIRDTYEKIKFKSYEHALWQALKEMFRLIPSL